MTAKGTKTASTVRTGSYAAAEQIHDKRLMQALGELLTQLG